MKAKKQDYKRINFQLPLSLAREFELAAQREGVTKAKLLRRWIRETNEIEILSRSKEAPVNFNLRIDLNTLSILKSWLITHQENMSTVMRSIMQSHFTLQNNSYIDSAPAINPKRLWHEGKIDELIQNLSISIEDLSLANLELLIRARLDSGQLKDIEDLISSYESHALKTPNPQNVFTLANIFRAENSIYKKNLLQAEYYLNVSKSALQSSNDRFLLHCFYRETGHLYENSDRHEIALDNYLKALGFIDGVNNPVETAKNYANIAYIYLGKQDFESARYFLDRAMEIAKGNNNQSYIGFLLIEEGLQAYIQNDLNSAQNLISKGITNISKINSPRGSYYSHDALSTLPLLRGNYDESFKLIAAAEKLESNFRPDIKYSRTMYIKRFIESKHNFSFSIAEMEKMNNIQIRPNKKELGKYYLYAAQYLHGSPAAKLIGERRLKQLAIEGKYPLIKSASTNLLLTKKLQPVR